MRRLLLSLLLAASIVGAITPTNAQAGTYSVWACADARSNQLPTGDWTPSTTAAQGFLVSTCGVSGTGAVAPSLQAIVGRADRQENAGINATWRITAPPTTTVTGLDVWWTNSASLQVPGRIEVFAGARSLYSRDSGNFGNVAAPLSDASKQTFSGFSEETAALVAWCVTGCASPERALASLFNAYRLRTVVTDNVPPAGEASGAAEGQIVSGPLTLLARATDAGSGVLDLALLVDGKVVETRTSARPSCQDLDPSTADPLEYALIKPCLGELPATADPPAAFTVSLAQLATAGAHNVSIIARDAAGTPGTLLSATVIVPPAALDGPAPPGRYARGIFFNPDVDLAGPARPNGLNAGPANSTLLFATRVVRRVKGKRRSVTALSRRRTISYSRTARMRGRVTTPTGVAIVGARVWRAISVAGGPWRIAGQPLVTSKTGRVSVKIAARSPSRRIQLVYFPSTDSNVSSRSRSAALAVRAPLSLSLARRDVPRGGRISMTARLLAGRRARRSVLGVLQVRKPSGWETVRQLRFTAARGGRGVARVALRLRTPAAYRFRVSVSAQSSLRYTRGVSAPRVLRVR